GSRLAARGSRLAARGSRLAARGSRLAARGSRLAAMVLLSPFKPIGNLSSAPWQRCERVHGNESRDRHRKDQRLGRAFRCPECGHLELFAAEEV
ncbi:hypothetical protein ACFRNT_47045, partial [Streptomyces sp. NPDC056697]